MDNISAHIFGFKVKETSEESKVTDIYLDNIKTYEANSEATVQLGLNVVICYFYGFENVIQIIRTTFSVISIYKCLSTRYAFLQYKVEPDFGIVMNAMAKHFIYVMSIFLIIFMVMFEKVVEFYIPLWSLVILVASFHPLILRIALLFPCIRKSKLDYIFTILGLLIFGFYIALYGCCFTSLYNATYENEYSTNVPNIHNGGNFCTKRRTTIFFIPKGYVPFKPISIPFDTFKLFYWIWIPALAILLLLILDVLRAFTKHDLLSKIFGPPVTLKEFLEGPRLQDPQLQEDQLNGNQDNVQDNIPMTKIDKIDENLESMNFCKHLENGNWVTGIYIKLTAPSQATCMERSSDSFRATSVESIA